MPMKIVTDSEDPMEELKKDCFL
ncbi:hypothetical protein A2U01_0067298, partial [Trifolium medium]|nr:hypothetical protein [Trifolium medium]